MVDPPLSSRPCLYAAPRRPRQPMPRHRSELIIHRFALTGFKKGPNRPPSDPHRPRRDSHDYPSGDDRVRPALVAVLRSNPDQRIVCSYRSSSITSPVGFRLKRWMDCYQAQVRCGAENRRLNGLRIALDDALFHTAAAIVAVELSRPLSLCSVYGRDYRLCVQHCSE